MYDHAFIFGAELERKVINTLGLCKYIYHVLVTSTTVKPVHLTFEATRTNDYDVEVIETCADNARLHLHSKRKC